MSTLFLVVGLPGAGKTVAAKELSSTHGALRFTPDEWMIPLFGESDAKGKRDVLEGRLISVALAALRLGTSVVLDFGLWSRDERTSLRWLGAQAGAQVNVVYLAVDRETQWLRIVERERTARDATFRMARADLDAWRADFEEPTIEEWAPSSRIESGPSAGMTWYEWASSRWPSFP